MFLSSRWRNERNKVKVVFKLQFHATQVGEDPLTLSGIPEGAGKPTLTIEKGLIRDGSCYWVNPIYETVKFTQEQKSGKINEKIYRFIVSKGSSKTSVIGEISIDFAKFVVASTNVSSLSIPLKNTKSGAVLHVKIQRVLESDTLRDVNSSDEHGRVRFNGRSLKTQLDMDESESTIKTELIEDKTVEQMDIISSGSNSSLDTLREFHAKINNCNQEERQVLSECEWLRGGSAPETSTDESSNSPREIIVSVETSPETIIEKLKVELADLSRQGSISELELQSLRKQIMKECKKGQDISKQMTMLKGENDELKKELTQYKSFRDRLDQMKAKDKLNFVEGDPWNMLGQLREELQYEKDLNRNLELQLQKTQDLNSELILAIQELSSGSLAVVSVKEMKENESINCCDDEEQRALEKLVMNDQVDCNEIVEYHIFKKDKDELEMQMEQLELDYEILKQENHDLLYKLEQNELQEQLKIQYECSSHSITTELKTKLKKQSEQLSKHEIHIHNLEEEMENMEETFKADLEILSLSKIEHEKRAIKAEEALRKMKMQNVNTVERLQEEIRRLFAQMTSTFDTNEKMATKAIIEASQLHFQKTHLEEMLMNAKEELRHVKDECAEKMDKLEKEKKSFTESTSVIGIPKQIANLKQKIKLFQEQLKLKEAAIETSANLFSRKEKDLLDKIKELERQVEEQLNQTGMQKASLTLTKEGEEMNKGPIEEELKEMERRYYEMSVRLAEVEGERQKLKMTVRSLKNSNRKTIVAAVELSYHCDD